jgi:DNA-directed RNA polymerase specialized sigma24 family protein
MAIDQKTTRKKDMAKLRRRIDGDDNFMSAHQIKKIRTRERDIPAWTLNNKEVQKVLLRAFPNLQNSRRMAARAGRWMRLIHLYYRVQMSNSQVAKEMGVNLNTVKMALKAIRRVARGRRADNSGPHGRA